MTRKLISSGLAFEEKAGYSRAVADGEWVFVAGTLGADSETGKVPASVHDQCEIIFAKAEKALAEGGASLGDVVRYVAYASDRAAIPEITEELGARFKGIRPAGTLVLCQLVLEDAKVEIEFTALRRDRADGGAR